MTCPRRFRKWVTSIGARCARRRGAVLVLSALLMVFLMGLLALSVDVGYMYTIHGELKRATDAAALAGVGSLVDGPDSAAATAVDFLLRNRVGSQLIVDEEGREALIAQWLAQHPDAIETQVGAWDPELRAFSTDYSGLPSAVRVVATYRNEPLFFARVLGFNDFSVQAESIARYQPRDIVLVLDFSASMNDDSELRRISEYGESWREHVENNLLQIYQELGSPSYGTLAFEPDYVTLVGAAPTCGCQPQISVKFLENEKKVYVASSKDLSNVVVQYSDGSTYKYDNLSVGTTGTFGSGSKQIDKVWVKSGCNESGEGPGYGERFERSWAHDYTTIKQWFGLDSVAYPYPSGSWDSYISYVQSSSYVKNAGYRYMYGHLTLINYWLEQKPQYNQTPDLWMTSAQPVDSLKDAVQVFMDYIQLVDCDDRVGLAIYNSPDQTALLEHQLTANLALLQDIVEHRQAGHYDRYTNIGAGIQQGWMELDAHARVGAKKLIVLMTDGQANRPSGYGSGFALEQAQIAAAKHYKIVCISLGSDADTSLMQQIADITGGVHFNIPGGESVFGYQSELMEVFRTIADDRPLTLVK